MRTLNRVRDRLRFADIRGMYLSDEERSELDREIGQLIEAIARCPTMDSAESKLDELDLLQGFLQMLSFQYRVDLSETQERLVHQYDNWREPHVRRANFEAIKHGNFP
jgi:hypothetical protein